MKVLQLIDSLDAGGAERVSVNIANALLATLEGSFLCATRKEGVLKLSLDKDVGYLFLNKKKTLDFKAIKLLNGFVRKNNITIIHAHATSFFLGTIIKILNPKLKLIWHDHYGKSEFLNERPKVVLRLCALFFNHVFSVNSKLETWAKTVLKIKQINYLPNFAVINLSQKRTILKGEANKRIVCLANLREQKDHFTLIKAFTLVKLKYPDWTLHLIGQDFNDDYSNKVKKMISEDKLLQHVFLYGSCPDTGAILKQCSIGVLSSKSEGLPLALLEYGLVGLPTIVTEVGQCKDVVQNNETGCIVKPEQIVVLSEIIIRYIENEKLRQKYGMALKKHVENKYSKSCVISNIKDIYNAL